MRTHGIPLTKGPNSTLSDVRRIGQGKPGARDVDERPLVRAEPLVLKRLLCSSENEFGDSSESTASGGCTPSPDGGDRHERPLAPEGVWARCA